MPEQELEYGDPVALSVLAQRAIEQGLEGWRGVTMVLPDLARRVEALEAALAAQAKEVEKLRAWQHRQDGDGR